jgi:hypothetical protein
MTKDKQKFSIDAHRQKRLALLTECQITERANSGGTDDKGDVQNHTDPLERNPQRDVKKENQEQNR